MSTELPSPASASTPDWPVLSMRERRVLGVLVEKAKTTPDIYPLSVNALVSGCNQKSNRDPHLNLSDSEVEDTLVSLQQQGLVLKITGGRVERWRHHLYETWHLGKAELAILAELLLRGPQTEGELRTRASRMEDIADLDTLRDLLRPLAERRLVVYLTPEGRRGTVLTHGFHSPKELEHQRAAHKGETLHLATEGVSVPAPSPVSARPTDPGMEARLAAVEGELAELRRQVLDLQKQIQKRTTDDTDSTDKKEQGSSSGG
ncbi:MAG: DUF480 domain-containing protein [Planctomycetes bacterium]|nr:DUF480 domain-containing protein [Planctomycetota bacterium]